MKYLLISTQENDKLLVGRELAASFLSKLSLRLDDLGVIEVEGSNLLKCTYKNPLVPDSPTYPILPASYVTTESGTGLVHSAPGHGAEDYNLLSKIGTTPF